MGEETIPAERIEALLLQSAWMRRLALGLARDPEQADDLMQDTWVAALRRAPQASAGELRAWLSVVLRNFASRRGRDRDLRELHEPRGARSEVVPGPDTSAVRVELQRALATALLELDEPLRSALVLRYFDSKSTRDVALALGISEANARQRISRALAKLRARLDHDHGSRGAWIALLPALSLPAASASAALPLGTFMAVKTKLVGVVVALVALGIGWQVLRQPESGAASAQLPLAAVVDPEPAAPSPPVVAPLATDPDVARTGAPAVEQPAVAAKSDVGNRTLIVTCVAKEDGRPLEGIVVQWFGNKLVRLEPGREGTTEMTKTGADGRASLALNGVGPWTITAWSRESLAAREVINIQSLGPEAVHERTIQMLTRADRRFFGRVLAGESGAPIAMASVLLGDSRLPQVSTDAEGRFELPYGPWGQFFTVAAPGRADVWFVPDESHASADTALELPLERGAELTIQFRGAPARIWTETVAMLSTPLRHQQRGSKLVVHLSRLGERTWKQTCDTSGRVRFTDLPPRLPLTLSWLDGGPKQPQLETLHLLPGEQRNIEVTLDTGCRVEGYVRDAAGRPLGAVPLWLVPDTGDGGAMMVPADAKLAFQKAITKADGSFTFDLVPPGAWRLGPSVGSSAFAPVALRLDVAAGDRSRMVELTLPDALFLRGLVLDPDARGVAGATVIGTHQQQWLNAQSAEGGHFVLGPLVAGRYELHALLPGGPNAPSLPILVNAGTEDVLLRMRAAGSVSGRLIFPEGKAPFTAWVIVTSVEQGAALNKLSTRLDGTFVARGLVGGTIHLAASTEQGLAGVARGLVLQDGQELVDVEILLEPAAHLTVRHEGAPGYVQVRCLLGEVVVASDGIQAGTDRNFVVAPGHLRVEVTPKNAREPIVRELDLSPGERKVVVFPDGD